MKSLSQQLHLAVPGESAIGMTWTSRCSGEPGHRSQQGTSGFRPQTAVSNKARLEISEKWEIVTDISYSVTLGWATGTPCHVFNCSNIITPSFHSVYNGSQTHARLKDFWSNFYIDLFKKPFGWSISNYFLYTISYAFFCGSNELAFFLSTHHHSISRLSATPIITPVRSFLTYQSLPSSVWSRESCTWPGGWSTPYGEGGERTAQTTFAFLFLSSTWELESPQSAEIQRAQKYCLKGQEPSKIFQTQSSQTTKIKCGATPGVVYGLHETALISILRHWPSGLTKRQQIASVRKLF